MQRSLKKGDVHHFMVVEYSLAYFGLEFPLALSGSTERFWLGPSLTEAGNLLISSHPEEFLLLLFLLPEIPVFLPNYQFIFILCMLEIRDNGSIFSVISRKLSD